MKIAVYYDVPFGGAHIATEQITSRLQKKHQLNFFKIEEPDFSGLPLKRLWKDLESIFFNKIKSKKLAQKIDKESFDVVFVSHDRHFQAPWLLRFLKTPTVFLCQEPTRAFFEDFLKVDPDLPILNKLYETGLRKFRKAIEVKNASFATKIISNSHYSEGAVCRAYGRHSTPVWLGVDTKDFYPLNLKRKNQVVVVGNNEPQKNLILAIESLALVDQKNRPKLIIVSPRHRKNKIKELAKLLEVKVAIKENVGVRGMRQIYNESKVTLAVAKLEPFGMSVTESIACGTPVVAINQGGFKETVIQNKTGLLVDPNPSSIASAISKLLDNEPLLKKMGQAGVVDAKKRFSWELTVNKIEVVLK